MTDENERDEDETSVIEKPVVDKQHAQVLSTSINSKIGWRRHQTKTDYDPWGATCRPLCVDEWGF